MSVPAPVMNHLNDLFLATVAGMKKLFKAPLVTIIVHNPDVDDGDVILTTDTLDGLQRVLDKQKNRTPEIKEGRMP